MSEYVPADYEHLSSRARWARRAVFLLIPIQLIAIGLSKVEIDVVDRARIGDVTREEVETLDQRQSMLSLVELGLFVVAGVFFLRWFYRAYKNLDVLGAERKHSTRSAVVYWFVPFLNLVRPKQMADEMWRGSEPSLDGPVTKAKAVDVWWGLWIVTGVLSFVATRHDNAVASLDDLKVADEIWIAVNALTIVAAFLAMRVVAKITQRQEQRARELGRAAAGLAD